MKQIHVLKDDAMLNSGFCYNPKLDGYKTRLLESLITKSDGGNSVAFCYR